MTMLNRVLLAAGLSWIYSVTLGLLFAASTSGRLSFSTLKLPGVVPVALISSTIIALVMTPIAAWSVRTGARNLYLYGPTLWIVLAAWLLLVVPWNVAYGEYSVLILGLVGLVILGFIPAHK
jgi:Na+/melibiose symporter-like transporter